MTKSPSDKYDVIICGTDLIQSILSSALSRAGKKVLHCDGNEWYGGFDAVLYTGSTLDCFIGGCQDASVRSTGGGKRDDIVTSAGDEEIKFLSRDKYADLKLHSQTFLPATEQQAQSDSTIELDESNKKATHGSADDEPDRNSKINTAESNVAKSKEESSDASILQYNFSIDISPDLLFASGDAVQGLVKSGVADYLEFKSLKGLFLLMDKDDSKKQRTNRSSSPSSMIESNGETSALDDALTSFRVPCSKGDVFRSQLLSPVDKRRLMKFLQLVSDYGLAKDDSASTDDQRTQDNSSDETTPSSEPTSEDAMYSINERYLNKGRSLSRPQNKAKPSTTELDSLIRCIRDNVDFAEYLSDVAKLPPRLSSVVTHALALAPFGQTESEHRYSTKNGVDDLLRHVSSLGRFGDTAFLIPMYGSGELSQAFCRSGAVFGSTYMLRRSPVSISVQARGDEDGKPSVRAVTLSGEEHIAGFADVDTDETSNKNVLCSHVIVPSTMLPSNVLTNKATRVRLYRRISIVKGALVSQREAQNSGEDKEQRYAVIIPPGTRGLNNASAVHGVILDDSAFVAPARKGYTVMHLTTSLFESEAKTEDDECLNILAKSVQLLIDSQSSEDRNARECHHISFSYSTDVVVSSHERQNDSPPTGLHICYRDTQSITCDYAFREAKRIFDDICPDADFLALAKKVEDSIVYKNKDDSDDEHMVLNKALDMLQEPQKAAVDVSHNELAVTKVNNIEADDANNSKSSST